MRRKGLFPDTYSMVNVLCILVFSVNVHNYIYIDHYIYIELLDRYFTRILLDKISLVIFSKLRKSSSQGTPLSNCFRRLQLLVASSTFNNVLCNNLDQKIFLRPLISYFCFSLITLQNFV